MGHSDGIYLWRSMYDVPFRHSTDVYCRYPYVGTDQIICKILYKPATMEPLGSMAVLNSTVDPTYDDTKSRPTQAQTFLHKATGAKFTYVIAHLKSKGSACTPSDPDKGDGQGNCAQTRAAAARAMVNWLKQDPTSSGDPDFMVMGDMNAYAMEDAIRAFTDNGYTNLIKRSVIDNCYLHTACMACCFAACMPVKG